MPLLALMRFYLRPYPWLLLGLLITIPLSSLLEGLSVISFLPVFNSLLGESAPQHAGLLGSLMKFWPSFGFGSPVLSSLFLLFLVAVAKSACFLVRDALMAVTSGRVHDDLKNQLMRSHAFSSYLFFQENKQGNLLYQLSSGASRAGILVLKVPLILSEALKVAIIGLFLLISMPAAAIGLVLLALAYHLLTRYLARKISYHAGKERGVAAASQSSIANEFLTGVRQILAANNQRLWLERFREQGRIFRKLYILDSIWLSVPKVLLELVAILFICGLLLYSTLSGPEGSSRSLPLMGTFAIGMLRILPSLTYLGQLRMEVMGLMGDAELIQHALTHPVPAPAGGTRRFKSLESGIVLNQAAFAYPGRPLLFDDLSLSFERGEVTAVVGPSGSGKSTLAYLLMGLIEPGGGRILVDGADLKEYDLQSWREQIGFVSQDLFIFHATVAENIAFGRPGVSSDQVRAAARIANAEEFVEMLPERYETTVGEKGMKLSGGQQQRIAIARAILHDPKILIFDEATSFLDAESERLVQEAIDRISRSRTVVLIAHRLSTIERANKIIVLEHGRVVEQGSHEELLSGRGRYFHLVAPHRGGPG